MGISTVGVQPRQHQCGTLYLVPLPIGNLRDITYRAVDVLRSVAVVAAEDTRDFHRIQREYSIGTPAVSYHDHNEQARAPELIARLLAGEDVALVSDAGMPLISDPGYRLVAAARDAGIPVTSLPGACAAVTALAASGLPVNQFLFAGFPPRTTSARRRYFAELRANPATLVFYEAPHRLLETCRDALAVLGNRNACLARNLTKPHERYQHGALDELVAALEAEGDVRGEVTLVIAGAVAGEMSLEDREMAAIAVRGMFEDGLTSRQVVERLQAEYGLKRREAYEIMLANQATGP